MTGDDEVIPPRRLARKSSTDRARAALPIWMDFGGDTSGGSTPRTPSIVPNPAQLDASSSSSSPFKTHGMPSIPSLNIAAKFSDPWAAPVISIPEGASMTSAASIVSDATHDSNFLSHLSAASAPFKPVTNSSPPRAYPVNSVIGLNSQPRSSNGYHRNHNQNQFHNNGGKKKLYRKEMNGDRLVQQAPPGYHPPPGVPAGGRFVEIVPGRPPPPGSIPVGSRGQTGNRVQHNHRGQVGNRVPARPAHYLNVDKNVHPAPATSFQKDYRNNGNARKSKEPLHELKEMSDDDDNIDSEQAALIKGWKERKLILNKSSGRSTSSDFSVISWNVSAGYMHIEDWEVRREKVLARLLWAKPDLLFLQELQLKDSDGVCNRDTNHAAWFRTNLRNQGYEGYYNKKIRGNSTVLVMWRKDKFTSQGVWSDFNNLQQNVAAGGPGELLETVEKFSKKRVLFVILKHIKSRKRMVACVGHASKPVMDSEQADHLPLIDMAGVASELDLAAHYLSPGKIPLPVICGVDMNSKSSSVTYKMMTSGRLPPGDGVYTMAARLGCELPDHIGHNLRLSSAYKTVTGSEPAYTTLKKTQNVKDTFDYIFHSEDTLEVLSCLDVYPLSNVFEIPQLPNQYISSDHIPLMAYMRFRR